tara:strand:- start:467 stop:643 length:177 start_codon:yes stop_codon:yes gene_type:complete
LKIKIEIELDTANPDDMDRLDELTAGALRSEFRQAAREIAEELKGSAVSEDIEEDNDE